MKPKLQIQCEDNSLTFEKLKHVPFAFISVISFESRCTTVAEKLVSEGLLPSKTFTLSYKTKAIPESTDKDLREENEATFCDLFNYNNNLVNESAISPYSSNVLKRQMEELIKIIGDNRIVIDITCMTRIHIIVLSELIASNRIDHSKVFFCYTAPQSYSVKPKSNPGWRDTILVSIGRNKPFRREGHARGIIFTGHDSERLSIALAELEPGIGILLFSNTPRRPDFLRRAREANKAIQDRLLTLRMPRSDQDNKLTASDQWSEYTFDINDFDRVNFYLEQEVNNAVSDDGPIILFPYGPKTLTLATAIFLASFPSVDSWAVYPIPDGYSISYSTGSSMLHWMKVIERI